MLEEPRPVGGLSSACMELLVENQATVNLPLIHRMGLPDAFVQTYGDQDGLLEKFGLQPNQLADKVIQLVEKNKLLQVVDDRG